MSPATAAGRERWQVSLTENGQRQDFAYNPTCSHARAIGHLLLVVAGLEDHGDRHAGAGPEGGAAGAVDRGLDRLGRDAARLRRTAVPLGMLPVQLQQQFFQTPDRSSLSGSVGQPPDLLPAAPRTWWRVDPRSGETLWVRQGFPPGCELFGDDQYVFVLSPDREEATLLRATDGELLGTRKVPRLSGTADASQRRDEK